VTIDVALGDDDSEVGRVQARYPCLGQVPLGGGIALRGTFPIIHNGAEVDSFKIELQLRSSGAHHRPAVLEIGGRVPRTADRHVNTDGSACIALPEDLWLRTGGEPMTLSAFVDGPVRDYFLAQASFEQQGRWPFGDRGHGIDGLREFYQELVGTRDPPTITRYLAVLVEPQVHRQWVCPCGSGQKLRRCHRDQVAALRQRVPPRVAMLLRGRLRAIV
jgi:hypothetical protein